MIIKRKYHNRILLFFVCCLSLSTNTFAVVTSKATIQKETALDKKDFIKSLERAKGQKLSFFEKIGAKLLLKRANKKKDTQGDKKKGMAIASLQLGVLSILGYLGAMSILGALIIPAGILAIVFGALAKKRAKKQPEIYGGRGMAIAGMVCGIASLSVILIGVVLIIILLSTI